MELSQLEYFNSVAMTGSFSLSAQQLGIPRPTLSLAITRLEQELGKQLFDRTGNKTALTADGQYLYGQIYSVFNIVQSTEQMIPLIQSGKEDVLTIGCYNCTLHICECIAAFSREHPEIIVNLVTLPVINVKNRWESMDCLFGQGIWDGIRLREQYRVIPVISDHYVVLYQKGSPLTYHKLLKIEDLSEEYWAFASESGNVETDATYQLCIKAGFNPKVRLLAQRPVSVLRAIANGDAITLIPRYGFKILKELNLYNFSNLKDVPEIQCNLYLDRMKEVTPALDLFVQFTLSFFHRY